MLASRSILTSLNQSWNISRRSCQRLCSAAAPNTLLVDHSDAPSDFDDSAVVYSNVISEAEETLLVSTLSTVLKRRRYEKGHWDSVIAKYKELELSDDSLLSPEIVSVFDRIRSLLHANHLSFVEQVHWLPPHVIDLHSDGELNAHVDSVRFSGLTVSGLSLLSPCIMRLRPSSDALDEWQGGSMDGHVDLLLPPRSLYCLSGPSRFRYSHELLSSGSLFQGDAVARDRRLSVVFRDTKA
ncbi:alpha-ketoglutarate-dependent dioxygenase alkB 7, mitochondrial [Mayamaea pseudoterrestris]|nr:alpha-ketoglutarate-dependent dioxygenase alkB 7, mitochondrial [Mayamaea pseudoterrestris]